LLQQEQENGMPILANFGFYLLLKGFEICTTWTKWFLGYKAQHLAIIRINMQLLIIKYSYY
jgi:hypothetical protein